MSASSFSGGRRLSSKRRSRIECRISSRALCARDVPPTGVTTLSRRSTRLPMSVICITNCPGCQDLENHEGMSVQAGPIGKSLLRLEDGPLLRGLARFVDDIKPDGALHVAFVRSPLASGRIRSIDVGAAAGAPGVVAVFTGADLDGSCAPMRVHLTTPGAVAPDRPIIAVDRVRFVGEIVAT